MRAPLTLSVSRTVVWAAALSLGLPLSAQDSPRSFSLPEPTPTPTAAPQGPVDIREGVVIGPRSIPQDDPLANEAEAVAPPALEDAPLPTPIEPLESLPEQAPQTAIEPPVRNAPTVPAAPPRSPPAEPAQSLPVDQLPKAAETSSQSSIDALTLDPPETQVTGDVAQTDSKGFAAQPIVLAAIGGLLALLAALGFWAWRRRTGAPQRSSASAPVYAPPTPSARALPVGNKDDGAPGASLPVDPRDLDLRLEILSGSRSFMKFNIEYRLSIANRADRAVRDLAIDMHLASARRDADGDHTAPSSSAIIVERIGPHQSHVLSGEVQLPLGEVHVIRQGRTPIFVPLLHVALAASGFEPHTRSFVIGTPSTASQTRLHPIPLDQPPGGLPGLVAQMVKSPVAA